MSSNRRTIRQSTDLDETEELEDGSQVPSVHNFDSSSIHTTDFLSTTTDVEEWAGMSTNPNTPKLDGGRQKGKNKPKPSIDTITTDDDGLRRKMSDMTIATDREDDETNESQRLSSYYDSTPTNQRRPMTSVDETSSATGTRQKSQLSTDLDSSRYDDATSESRASKKADRRAKEKGEHRDHDKSKHRSRKEKTKSGETTSQSARTTTGDDTASMSGTLTDHQTDSRSLSHFSDVSSIDGRLDPNADPRRRLESKDTIHTDATSMITIDGVINSSSQALDQKGLDRSVTTSLDPGTTSAGPTGSATESTHSRQDLSSTGVSASIDKDISTARLLSSTDNDSKNGTPLMGKKTTSRLSTDGDSTPTNSRRYTDNGSDLGDSVSQRGGNRKSIDTLSHDSSTLHAPPSITSGNLSQQISSHMRSDSEDQTSMQNSQMTPKLDSKTMDTTSITASTTADSSSIKMTSAASIKAEDAISVSGASATGSTATAGTQGTHKTDKTHQSESSQKSKQSDRSKATLSSAQATHDTASSHGLAAPTSDTASISTDQILDNSQAGADTSSMTRSVETPTDHRRRGDSYMGTSDQDSSKLHTRHMNLNSADTMSLTTLSRHPSMMSVTSSGQMSSVSQQKRKDKKNLFNFSGSETASVSSKQVPKVSRITSIYKSVYQGISDYISIFTAELNVLQTQLMHEETPMEVKIDLEKQLKSTERILTKLHYQQQQATEIYEQYQIQEKYQQSQKQLKNELQSTPQMQQLERELESYLGRFHVKMKGLLGFARLKAGDNYEVTIKYGGQRWKLKGQVKSSFEQIWDSTDFIFKPKVGDIMAIKVAESRSVIRKQRVVGNVTCETKDLFSAELQELAIDLNSIGSLKISLNITWSPFDPSDPTAPPIELIMARLQSSSDMQMGGSDLMSSGRSMISGDATSLSQSSAFGKSDTDGANSIIGRSSVKTETTLTNSVTASSGLRGHRSASGHGRSTMTPGSSTMDLTESESGRGAGSILGEEGLIMKRVEQFEHGRYDQEEDYMNKHRDILEEIQNSMDPRPQKVFMGAEMADLGEINELQSKDLQIGQRLLDAINSLNLTLDDYRGRYRELRPLEENLQALHVLVKRGGREAPPPLSLEEQSALNAFEFLDGDNSTMIDDDLISQSYKSCRTELFEDDDVAPTTGNPIFDEALLPHVQTAEIILPNLGIYGPCRVKEILSIDKLIKHGFIIGRYLELVRRKQPLAIEQLPEVRNKITALTLWQSSCDGRQRLAVTGKIFRMELRGSYGQEVKSKHNEVADKVFPEIVRRILGIQDVTVDIEERIVTLHQWLTFYHDRDIDEQVDFIKYVDRVALEIFITGMLESKMKRLVLSAIKRLQGLLALRHSNLKALCVLLLDEDKEIRNAAAAHLAHIGTDVSFREKALCTLLELLEDEHKTVRWAAALGLGFIGCREAVKHIQYTFMADIEPEVREACKNVLISFGKQGRNALDEACCTLLAQTMSHTVHIAHRSRMGTSL